MAAKTAEEKKAEAAAKAAAKAALATAAVEQVPNGTEETAPDATRAFRQMIAAVVPKSQPFGSAPAARIRLEEALSQAGAAVAHVKRARGILNDLAGQTVTGSKESGLTVLGDEAAAFEALTQSMELMFALIRGEEPEVANPFEE